MADTGRRDPLDTQAQNDAQATETRMRRALGLSASTGSQTPQQRPEQARARHRFVQDGGVPVVMLNHKPEPETAALRDRITALESALDAERSTHAGAKRALQEQQAQAQALQTRLAHNELAHTEALEGERRLRVAAQQALAELQAAPPRRTKLAAFLAPDVAPSPSILEPSPMPKSATFIEKPKRGRPRTNPLPEPKPVRWWTPSFKAKTKT